MPEGPAKETARHRHSQPKSAAAAVAERLKLLLLLLVLMLRVLQLLQGITPIVMPSSPFA